MRLIILCLMACTIGCHHESRDYVEGEIESVDTTLIDVSMDGSLVDCNEKTTVHFTDGRAKTFIGTPRTELIAGKHYSIWYRGDTFHDATLLDPQTIGEVNDLGLPERSAKPGLADWVLATRLCARLYYNPPESQDRAITLKQLKAVEGQVGFYVRSLEEDIRASESITTPAGQAGEKGG